MDERDFKIHVLCDLKEYIQMAHTSDEDLRYNSLKVAEKLVEVLQELE